MLQYILAGLALGSIYAIASAALVVTYVSAGVFNFAFGSMAYVVARFYYWLNSQHGMSTVSAGLLAILVLAPLLGVVLYAVLFRFIRNSSTLVKIVATIGLSVALPPISDLIFGNQAITSAPGLASLNDEPFHILGTVVTTDQVITYGFLLFVVAAGTVVLRLTDVGLKVRAMVDSEAMSSLSGTHPGRVSLGVWAVSSTLAGLAGVLVAPTDGLSPGGMTALMSAAIAAVVAARLRSLPGAVVAALAMGVITDVIQKYLPTNSSLTAAIVPSVPFAFMVVFLIFYVVRSGSVDEDAGAGGPLDQAIRPASQDSAATAAAAYAAPWEKWLGLVPLVVVAFVPLMFRGSPYWLGLTALGLCYGITYLTFTVATGEGGMLWLSQIVFAGAGALGAAQFATNAHLPVLLAIVLAGLIAAAAGAVLGLLTIRLGDLYVGLATLTFGLLVETLVFTRGRFLQGGLGVIIERPGWAVDDLTFAYLALGVFAVLAALTLNLRRSTSGLALRGVRDSAPAARTLGLSVVQVKVIVGALAAFVAAVGGAFVAMYQMTAQPTSWATYAGLVWLAVVVTLGVRSISAALLAGLSFTLMQGVLQSYAPARLTSLLPILFGLGAIGVARNPEGAVPQAGRQLRGLLTGALSRIAKPSSPATPALAGMDVGTGAPPPVVAEASVAHVGGPAREAAAATTKAEP
ncbi:ABC transporter permease [Pseudofrankia sp. BMG5.37]|uniref:ABC transporter permease n=1 Tax=Pseudofrankia sp. BMG5.37 TaxID=3050035 RepID=UPI0028943E7D|nr:ABC transporter permease [Pseudofrankia sp. BMG5.37]MDT3441511.1 ABC transporter permease [Pseudofrankia sp. BMG5.37]